MVCHSLFMLSCAKLQESPPCSIMPDPRPVIVLNLDDPPVATLKELTPPIDWEARRALGRGPDLFMQEMRDKYGLPGNWDEGSDTLDETIRRLKTYLEREGND